MAQHVQDSAVTERRLRPIYDSLEAGNIKKALQETEKVLKKHPHLLCARALKSLTLLRLGRDDESQTILEELEKEKPCDESTLKVMTFCYRETEKLDKICTMYMEASKVQPGNEEILSHLFVSYVRINDYKSQQSVALQLFKLKPKNPYYFWAVMSVVLQALRGPDCKDKTKRNLLLALAQRMVDKLMNEDKLNAAQEIQLYLSILQHQEKHEEALAFLDNPVCIKLYPTIPVSDKIELMKKVDKWGDVNKLLKELLLESRDRWDYYKEYIDSTIRLYKSNDTTNGADYNFEMCHEFICHLIENGKKVRGPYLARLQLHKCMTENNIDPKESLGDFLELLVEYFRFFGDKPCCANDLKLFLNYLEPYRRAGLASRLIHDCGISSTTLPQSKEQMQKHICALQISRMCGAHAALSSELLSALYTALTLHYEHGMNAFGANLLSTDMGPSDPYALLAVYIMYDLAIQSNSSERLVEALCLLHYLLRNSPSNFHAKLLCLQIYHILGCGWGAINTYKSLEVKHIQLDSLGYLHCALMPSLGLPSNLKNLYETTLKFFTTSYKDSSEYLAMSYKFGSFSKLEEFMDFRERLSNSLHYTLISVESLLSDIVCWTHNQSMVIFKNMNIHPEEDRIKWDELRDNRDLSVLVKWDPSQLVNSKEHEEELTIESESFEQDKELLKIRSLLLRLVAASVEFLNAYSGQSVVFEKNHEVLQKLYTQWIELFRSIKERNYKKTSQKYLVNILPSRLHMMLRLPYEIFFTNLFKFINELFTGDTNEKRCTNSAEEVLDEIAKIEEFLCSGIKEHKTSKDLLWERREVQEGIVGSIEILSLASFVLSICYEKLASLINTSNAVASRKLKKNQQNQKPQPQVQTQTASANETTISNKQRQQILVNLFKKLKLTFTNIDNSINEWETPVIPKNLTDTLASLSLNPSFQLMNPKVEELVESTFKEDHIITIYDLRLIIVNKIKLINKS